MGRPLAPRRDYARDAQTLQRIVMAVQSDESRPQEWRREQVNHLTEVIVAFNRDAVRDRPPSTGMAPADAEELRQLRDSLGLTAPRAKRKASR